MESRYIQDPYFVDGAARHTLYEAYLGRGKDFMLIDYEVLTSDFLPSLANHFGTTIQAIEVAKYPSANW